MRIAYVYLHAQRTHTVECGSLRNFLCYCCCCKRTETQQVQAKIECARLISNGIVYNVCCRFLSPVALVSSAVSTKDIRVNTHRRKKNPMKNPGAKEILHFVVCAHAHTRYYSERNDMDRHENILLLLMMKCAFVYFSVWFSVSSDDGE